MIFNVNDYKEGENMRSLEVKKDIHWVGALDPELRIFDIIMYTPYGTTYKWQDKCKTANATFDQQRACDNMAQTFDYICKHNNSLAHFFDDSYPQWILLRLV